MTGVDFPFETILGVPPRFALEGGERADERTALEDDDIWGWFGSEMQAWRRRPYDDQVANAMAELTLRLLHWRLRRGDSGYRESLDRAQLPRQSYSRDWRWQALFDTATMRVGLLSVYADRPMLVHDHSAADGMLLVVAGSARARRFLSHGERDRGGRLELQSIADRDLGFGDVALYRHEHGFIHGLEATSTTCVFLHISIALSNNDDKEWYLAVDNDALDCEQRVVAERVPFGASGRQVDATFVRF